MKPLLLALVAAFAISISACTTHNQNESVTPVLSGPPNTTLPMPPINARGEMGWVLGDGSRARLADYQSKVLVLDFYATWCEPCRKSIPRLIAMQQKFENEGLQVVGLNVGGPDDRVKVSRFAADLHISYPLGFPDKTLTDLFLVGDQTIPQTFVFGRDGQLVKRFIGYDQTTESELGKVIEETMRKS